MHTVMRRGDWERGDAHLVPASTAILVVVVRVHTAVVAVDLVRGATAATLPLHTRRGCGTLGELHPFRTHLVAAPAAVRCAVERVGAPGRPVVLGAQREAWSALLASAADASLCKTLCQCGLVGESLTKVSQTPQWYMLVWRSKQNLRSDQKSLQSVWPGGQPVTQSPLRHHSLSAHFVSNQLHAGTYFTSAAPAVVRLRLEVVAPPVAGCMARCAVAVLWWVLRKGGCKRCRCEQHSQTTYPA